MAKNDNPHSIRLVESVRRTIGEDAAKEIEMNYSLSKSANLEKKFTWAKEISDYLEDKFDTDSIMNIRKGCICNNGKSTAKMMQKYLAQTNTIKEFVTVFNENETFASFEYRSENNFLYCYPECYCSCVKRVSQELSKTWCYCTLGYAESLFLQVFEKPVKVTLRKSIKTGGDRCEVEVEW